MQGCCNLGLVSLHRMQTFPGQRFLPKIALAFSWAARLANVPQPCLHIRGSWAFLKIIHHNLMTMTSRAALTSLSLTGRSRPTCQKQITSTRHPILKSVLRSLTKNRCNSRHGTSCSPSANAVGRQNMNCPTHYGIAGRELHSTRHTCTWHH